MNESPQASRSLPMQRNDRLSGYVWILLAAFFWSLIGVISKI